MSERVADVATMSAYQRWELAAFDERPPQPATRVTVNELEALQEQARAEGRAAGYAEGSARAAEEVSRLQAIVASAAAAVTTLENALAIQVLDLSLDLARQLLREALRVKPELVLPVVREALGALPAAAGRPRLRLHPQDAALVRQHLAERIAASALQVEEDPAIERGGCRLEAESGEVDATLPTRWRRVLAALGRSDEWLER